MGKYILKKLALGIVLILCVSFLVFSMLYLMPGDPVTIMAGQLAKIENLESLREEYGFNRPFLVQYLDWLQRVVFHHDIGLMHGL